MANLVVSGTLSPDATGTYVPTGGLNDGKPVYAGPAPLNYFIWWLEASSAWLLSAEVGGGFSESFWLRFNAGVEGAFSPAGGDAVGTATVAEESAPEPTGNGTSMSGVLNGRMLH